MISFENSNKFEFNDVENQLKENLKFSLDLKIKFKNHEFKIGDIIKVLDKANGIIRKFKIRFGLYFDGEGYIDNYHLGVYLEDAEDNKKEKDEMTFPDFIEQLIKEKYEIIQPNLEKLEQTAKQLIQKFAKIPDSVSYNDIIWKLEEDDEYEAKDGDIIVEYYSGDIEPRSQYGAEIYFRKNGKSIRLSETKDGDLAGYYIYRLSSY